MDSIKITGLEVYAYHGVYDEEKQKGQHFVINATLSLDTFNASSTDDISDTPDYANVSTFISDFVKSTRFNLIETVANELCRKLLITYEKVKEATIEVCKPEAPIPVKFSNVSVTVTKNRHIAYISVGSNMGDREGFIQSAIDNLEADENIKIMKVSSLIETKPYGNVDQDDFLNGVFKIETIYSPEELLDRLHIEENEAGRERKIHWGPRTLDLDIILFDGYIMLTDDLVIPHPDMTNREFVLKPLCEIDPYVIHPRFMLTAKELLDKLNH